ncbi:MAG: DUF2157 domain-containing protein [Kiritimatiellae bacterium]|nr:DUF2157 domain-containing protein [Kiritimatiellia bacterium]
MSKIEWLNTQISSWQAEGLITVTQADALLARYAAATKPRHWGKILAGAFSALLIGLGIIALFAANWNEFNRPMRAAIALAPLTLCGIAALVAAFRQNRSTAFWEPLGILWFITTIAAFALVAQTYQISHDLPAFIFGCALLTLPVVYLTRSVTVLALWPILPLVRICVRINDFGRSVESGNTALIEALLYFALTALAIPTAIKFFRSKPNRLLRENLLAVLSITCSVGICMTFAIITDKGRVTEAIFAIPLILIFALHLALGRRYHSPVLTGLGILYFGWGNILVPIPEAIDHITDNFLTANYIALNGQEWGMATAIIIGLLGTLVWAIRSCIKLNLVTTRELTGLYIAAALPIAYIAVAALYNSVGDMLAYLLQLGYAGYVLVYGLRHLKLSDINIGVALFCYFILVKFFSSEWSFTIKGIILILCGVVLAAVNIGFARYKRSLTEKTAKEVA